MSIKFHELRKNLFWVIVKDEFVTVVALFVKILGNADLNKAV